MSTTNPRRRLRTAMYTGTVYRKLRHVTGSACKAAEYHDPTSPRVRCWEFRAGGEGEPILVLERDLRFL